jgi:hypothetical protein
MQTAIRTEGFTKSATTDEERRRLAAEADILIAAAHPGVVRLVEIRGGDPPSELVTAEVKGGSATRMERPLEWTKIAGLGASLATTLADLHELGIVHRRVGHDHVLLDDGGRPVLCGLGKATLHPDVAHAESDSVVDLVALVALLGSLGDGRPPREIARLLNSASRPRRGPRRMNARRFAREMVRACPDARLPSANPDPPIPGNETSPIPTFGQRIGPLHRRHPSRRIALLLVMIAVISAGVGFATNHGSAVPRPSTACPSVDQGCTGHAVAAGSVLAGPSRSFVLLGITGVAVLGRWRCSGSSTPAVLDSSSGRVWVFGDWPTGTGGSAARLVGHVEQATGLRSLPGSGRTSRCDSLVVERRGLAPLTLRLGRR